MKPHNIDADNAKILQERKAREKAIIRRCIRARDIRPGELWWGENGFDDNSSEVLGTNYVIISPARPISHNLSGRVWVEMTWKVLATEESGKMFIIDGFRFLCADLPKRIA